MAIELAQKTSAPQPPPSAKLAIQRWFRLGTSSQLRRNTVVGGIGALGGAAISAVQYPVFLHFLGYEQYGLWLAVSVVLSFAAFGHLGLAPAVATTVAAEYAGNDLAGLRRTVSTALITLTTVGLIAVAMILLGRHWIVGELHLRPAIAAQAETLLPFVAFLSLYVVQIDTLNAVLVGLGRLDLAVGIQLAGRALTLAVAALLLAGGVGVVSLPIASLAGNVFVHIASLSLAGRIIRQSCISLRSFDRERLRGLTSFGSGVLASTMINFLLNPFNKFILTRYLGPSSVPVYDMAYNITMQVRGLLEAGFRSLMPEASRLTALASDEAKVRLRAVYLQAMKAVLFVGAPLFIAVMLTAHIGLQLWLGSRFKIELVGTLRVLLLGGFISLLGTPGYYMILGGRRVGQIVIGHLVQAGVNLAILLSVCQLGLISVFYAAAATSLGLAAGGLYPFIISLRDCWPSRKTGSSV